MTKIMRKVYIDWCICCHNSNTTLYKIGKSRICKNCRDSLINNGVVNIVSGGKLMRSKDDSSAIVYVPKEDMDEQANII